MDVLILDGATLGAKVRAMRALRGWTQGELAVKATEWHRAHYPHHKAKVCPQRVSAMERDWGIRRWQQRAILAVLGLEGSNEHA